MDEKPPSQNKIIRNLQKAVKAITGSRPSYHETKRALAADEARQKVEEQDKKVGEALRNARPKPVDDGGPRRDNMQINGADGRGMDLRVAKKQATIGEQLSRQRMIVSIDGIPRYAQVPMQLGEEIPLS